MGLFLDEHPIRFRPDEIVEADEIFLKPLLVNGDETDDETRWLPVIGMIARGGGPVALDIVESRSTNNMAPAMLSHLPSRDTIVITDGHRSYGFLKRVNNYVVCQKAHYGATVCPVVREERIGQGAPFKVHTNTIEGFWSQLRCRLHASHGWEARYLPYILFEFQFRSLNLPVTAALRV